MYQTRYYLSNRSELPLTVNNLNSDLKCVSKWAKLNGLDLNEAKMQAIVINNKTNELIPQIFLNETAIKLFTSVKNLGLALMLTLTLVIILHIVQAKYIVLLIDFLNLHRLLR